MELCPKCGADVPAEARFCESCGQKLEARTTAGAGIQSGNRCRCGAGPNDVDEQGYCTGCGIFRATLLRDHHEAALSPEFAAVTDRGLRHAHNEDDMALATETDGTEIAWILVVCDGLSSAQDSASASTLAAKSACDGLAKFVREQGSDPAQAMHAAILAAQQAVCALDFTPSAAKDPPATTLVAALVQNGIATMGWIGDSRAYCFSSDMALQLTRDHSWVNQVVDAGEMSEEEALQSRNAHAITRCLGRIDDDDPEVIEPSLLSFEMPPDSILLLCSDGLWNYASAPDELAALVRTNPPESDALTIARNLTDFARQAGGRDNITSAVLRYRSRPSQEDLSQEESNAI